MTLLLMLCALWVHAQKIDADLLRIKQRMDSVQHFSAMVTLNLDVPFIQMPTKNAEVNYQHGSGMKFASKDFVMLPKRGLDFSMNELFKHPFITVDRGTITRGGKMLKVINLIPTDGKSDLVMAVLYMDTKARHLVESEINTRKDGSYTLQMQYQPGQTLPQNVEAAFAIERLKIPLNFMGKDTKIDRKKMRSMETKTGKIKMQFRYRDVKLG
uniref:hypothetical protein n=1 Tax=Mucilaginibacter sp. Bleaf8 TaxID=2834430 RepID=UPI0020BD4F45|nr:hypothetical protein [Mucilaginibacter sp. Bleaf8]